MADRLTTDQVLRRGDVDDGAGLEAIERPAGETDDPFDRRPFAAGESEDPDAHVAAERSQPDAVAGGEARDVSHQGFASAHGNAGAQQGHLRPRFLTTAPTFFASSCEGR